MGVECKEFLYFLSISIIFFITVLKKTESNKNNERLKRKFFSFFQYVLLSLCYFFISFFWVLFGFFQFFLFCYTTLCKCEKNLYNNGAIKLQRIFTYVNAQFFIEYSPGVIVDVIVELMLMMMMTMMMMMMLTMTRTTMIPR